MAKVVHSNFFPSSYCSIYCYPSKRDAILSLWDWIFTQRHKFEYLIYFEFPKIETFFLAFQKVSSGVNASQVKPLTAIVRWWWWRWRLFQTRILNWHAWAPLHFRPTTPADIRWRSRHNLLFHFKCFTINSIDACVIPASVHSSIRSFICLLYSFENIEVNYSGAFLNTSCCRLCFCLTWTTFLLETLSSSNLEAAAAAFQAVYLLWVCVTATWHKQQLSSARSCELRRKHQQILVKWDQLSRVRAKHLVLSFKGSKWTNRLGEFPTWVAYANERLPFQEFGRKLRLRWEAKDLAAESDAGEQKHASRQGNILQMQSER